MWEIVFNFVAFLENLNFKISKKNSFRIFGADGFDKFLTPKLETTQPS